MKDLEERFSGAQKQNDIVITPAKMTKHLRKIANWKAPEPDGLQGFWLKGFTSCTERIALQLQDCLTTNQIPEWLTRGRTTLIIKDKEKRNVASNYRPITCLALMWKLCTGIMGDELGIWRRKTCYLMNKRAVEETQEAQKISY